MPCLTAQKPKNIAIVGSERVSICIFNDTPFKTHLYIDFLYELNLSTNENDVCVEKLLQRDVFLLVLPVHLHEWIAYCYVKYSQVNWFLRGADLNLE